MDLLREIVSGPKNRLVEDGFNLDLTYLTPRIIAMSYPANGIESMYRNPIEKVQDFLNKKHKQDFLVVNLSGRKYDYSKFHNNVIDCDWMDHYAPPLLLLF